MTKHEEQTILQRYKEGLCNLEIDVGKFPDNDDPQTKIFNLQVLSAVKRAREAVENETKLKRVEWWNDWLKRQLAEFSGFPHEE